jgi:hypothetical protein
MFRDVHGADTGRPRICGHDPELVDAMAMVGMVMGDDHPIDLPNSGRQQLLPEIRAAINQQPFALTLDQD